MSKENKHKEFIELLKSIREEKDLDGIQELMLSIFTVYGLTTDEVAALLFSTMNAVLSEKHNAEFLSTKFGINIKELPADGVLQVQRALLGAHLDKVREDAA